MSDEIVERLTRLEEAVRRAGDTLVRLREENDRLRRDMRRMDEERRQVVGQIDAILKDINRLDLGESS
jgi:FtsZ-binding cell division protein ZapB